MRRRTSLAGAVTAALLALGTSIASSASAAPAELSGTVTDPSGSGVATCVEVYTASDDSYVESACSDDTGGWTASGLDDGTAYVVHIEGTTALAEQWYDRAADMWSATSVTPPAHLDTVLAETGTLQGTLTDQNGLPVDGASVSVVDSAGSFVTNAFTAPDGTWSAQVAVGTYKIEYSNWPEDMWYRQSFSFDTADSVTVTAGAVTHADTQFVEQGTVVGTVTDARSGAPLSDVCAQVFPTDWTSNSETNSVGYGCSNSDGQYRATVSTPGTYVVQFIDQSGRYVGVFSGGTRDVRAARTVDVGPTGDVTVDQSMNLGAVITGRALDSRTHAPLAGVNPALFSGAFGPPNYDWSTYAWGIQTTESGPDGVYRIGAVPPGTYDELLTPRYESGYAQQWYDNATVQTKATAVVVKGLTNVSLKDAKFVPGGRVTGTVTDSAGRPVAGAWVDLGGYWGGRMGGPDDMLGGQTDENGHYSILAPGGSYRPIAYDLDADLAPSFAGGAATLATTKPVDVKPTKTTDLDFTLVPGGHLTGRVMASDGSQPGGAVTGDVYTTTGDFIGTFDTGSQTDWSFRSTALPAGSFVLKLTTFDESSGEVTGTSWYDGSTDRAGATTITLGAGEDRNLAVHLP